MTFAVAAISHSPMLGRVDPGGTIYDEIQQGVAGVRNFVEEFDPELIVSFGPDHLNGVLYEMMPPFCIGAQAVGVGDWGTKSGPLPVASDEARFIHERVLQSGIDCPRSERLKVDHGMLQTVEFVFGDELPEFVPIYVNAVGVPLAPMQRVRLLGEAVGRAALELDKRTLFMASGGLSHDPPIAAFDTADEAGRERLISADITPEQMATREGIILKAAQKRAEGGTNLKQANEQWDRELLRVFATGELTQADGWGHEWMIQEGGSGAEEMRSWLAAFAALSAGGSYQIHKELYWASERWGGGFGVVTAKTS